MPTTVIVGTQWGDEGKGKIVDYLSRNADVVVRFQGGSNAGHTVKVGEEIFRFHILPSGILRNRTMNIIANGVVVDPEVLLDEIVEVKKQGFSVNNLRISDRAHVILPYHKILDRLEEEAKSGLQAGTTRRGIGPCFQDKVGRFGLRMIDMLDPDVLRDKLGMIVPLKQKMIEVYGGFEQLSLEDLCSTYSDYGQKLGKYVTDTGVLLHSYIKKDKNVIFEGAQGTHLCIDHGIYPFGTSSNCIAGAACTGAGISPTMIENVIGVVKAYTSRVGTGPFPTELHDEIGSHLRDKGGEYGTTTGRPRRCGWLDLVMIRYSARVNGLNSLVVTKLDVLDGLETLKVCESYDFKGTTVQDFPANMDTLSRVKPVYRELPGWREIGESGWRRIASRGFSELPKEARAYLKYLANSVGVKISLIGVGKRRDEIINLTKKKVQKTRVVKSKKVQKGKKGRTR